MNMSLTTHSSLRMLVAGAFAVATAACASAPTPPPVAAAPPSQAFQQASSPGAAEAQGTDDGVVFVSQDRKDPATHQDSAPATSLHADQQAARPSPKN
jgi:hypothetical protein